MKPIIITCGFAVNLSVCIKVFVFICRMNGLTGKKMQDIFETLVPPATSTNARYLVEYCCFRFLSRDSSEFHPCLKVSECFLH